MKKKKFYFVGSLLIFLAVNSCNDSGVNSTNLNSIQLVSYNSNGCIATLKSSNLDRINDDETIIETNYSMGLLEVKLYFSTLCSAEMRDSIQTDESTLWIFLEDTNDAIAMCVCPHKEEFLFEVAEMKRLEIKFSYKSIASTEYHLMADTTIDI